MPDHWDLQLKSSMPLNLIVFIHIIFPICFVHFTLISAFIARTYTFFTTAFHKRTIPAQRKSIIPSAAMTVEIRQRNIAVKKILIKFLRPSSQFIVIAYRCKISNASGTVMTAKTDCCRIILIHLSLITSQRVHYQNPKNLFQHAYCVGYGLFIRFHAIFIHFGFILFPVGKTARAPYTAAHACHAFNKIAYG